MSDTYFVTFRTFKTTWQGSDGESGFKVVARTRREAFVVATITIHLLCRAEGC